MLALLSVVLLPAGSFAQAPAGSVYAIPVTGIPTPPVPVPPDPTLPYEPDPSPEGQRAPSRQLECVIDLNHGVSISGIPSADILAYEICEPTASLMILSSEEFSGFVEFLKTASGVYIVRFITEDYIYQGLIDL